MAILCWAAKNSLRGTQGVVASMHGWYESRQLRRVSFRSQRLAVFLVQELKGSDQWEVRGFGNSPKHKILVGGLVLDVSLTFQWAAILFEEKLILPRVKQKRIAFAANNSLCCEFHVAPTILLCAPTWTIKNARNILFETLEAPTSRCWSTSSAD